MCGGTAVSCRYGLPFYGLILGFYSRAARGRAEGKPFWDGPVLACCSRAARALQTPSDPFSAPPSLDPKPPA